MTSRTRKFYTQEEIELIYKTISERHTNLSKAFEYLATRIPHSKESIQQTWYNRLSKKKTAFALINKEGEAFVNRKQERRNTKGIKIMIEHPRVIFNYITIENLC